MIPRPKSQYVRKFRKEEPPKAIRAGLVKNYRFKTFEKFEDDNVRKLADVDINQPASASPLTGKVLQWKYVGDLWWCRKVGKYEFARLVALDYRTGEVNGLWDCRRHDVKSPPVVVRGHDVNGKVRKGYISGFNEFEVFVQWEDEFREVGLPEPVRGVSTLEFEYIEDFKKFSKMFRGR